MRPRDISDEEASEIIPVVEELVNSRQSRTSRNKTSFARMQYNFLPASIISGLAFWAASGRLRDGITGCLGTQLGMNVYHYGMRDRYE